MVKLKKINGLSIRLYMKHSEVNEAKETMLFFKRGLSRLWALEFCAVMYMRFTYII